MIHIKKIPGLALVFYMLFSISLQAEEEIVVKLATETKMLPVALFPITPESTDCSTAYLSSLSSVLTFDMNINGMTEVRSIASDGITLIADKERAYDSAVDYNAWKGAEILYLIKMKATKTALSVKVISINEKSVKSYDGIALTGSLAQDRCTIHQVHDAIFEQLFHKKGIASSKILYTVRQKIATGDGDWISEIYESDYDGANAHEITYEGTYIVTPAFKSLAAYGGKGSLLYVSYKIGQPKIFYVSPKEKQPRRLTQLKGNQLTPAISPDGSKIAFTSDVTGSADLFFVHFQPTSGALGKPRQIFTAKGTSCASPTFSKDSSRIAFVCNKDGSPKIYVMEIPPEGASIKDVHPQLISKRCRENSAPCWSLDGTKIAYAAKSGGSRQIWMYNFETGEERELTSGPGDKENPSWASDSSHIIFNSTEKNSTELFLMNIHQKKCLKISTGSGEKRFPCWE